MMTEQRVKLLGVKAVADACGVTESAVYYWLNHNPDLPQPLYEVAGPLGKDGKRKLSVAWSTDQLHDILDWRQRRKA